MIEQNKKRILESAEPKRARVKYPAGIDRAKHIKKWREWEDLQHGANKH